MPRINRIDSSSAPLQVQGVQSIQSPQFNNFQDLRAQYRFPGSQQLLAWKKSAPSQDAYQRFADIFQSRTTSREGFDRIAQIGNGSDEKAQDDRVAIGLILNAVNSGDPEVKRVGLEYMQALLEQSKSPEKRKFVYDSIVNNLINSVGWSIEEKHSYQAGREILSGLDTFSLMILRQYNIYPNMDLQTLLQPRGLSHRIIDGASDFQDVQAHLQSRLLGDDGSSRLPELFAEDEPRMGNYPFVEDFLDIEGYRSFPNFTIVWNDTVLDVSLLPEVSNRQIYLAC